MNAELFTALENLVQLKRWKDKHGKDEHYQRNVQPVWNAAFSTYDKYAANPRLLKEDGEKEERKIQDPMTYAQSMAKKQMEGFPRPTDEQQMEQEAREMLKKYGTPYDSFTDTLCFKNPTIILAALTEFGKMWKERGREEGRLKSLKDGHTLMMKAELDEAKQELSDKEIKSMLDKLHVPSDLGPFSGGLIGVSESDLFRLQKDVEEYKHFKKKCYKTRMLYNKLEKELTAAKAEIEKLKNKNGNLELALKNLQIPYLRVWI